MRKPGPIAAAAIGAIIAGIVSVVVWNYQRWTEEKPDLRATVEVMPFKAPVTSEFGDWLAASDAVWKLKNQGLVVELFDQTAGINGLVRVNITNDGDKPAKNAFLSIPGERLFAFGKATRERFRLNLLLALASQEEKVTARLSIVLALFALLLPKLLYAETPTQAAALFLLKPPYDWEKYSANEVISEKYILRSLDATGCHFRLVDRNDAIEYTLNLDTIWTDEIEYFDFMPWVGPVLDVTLSGRGDVLVRKVGDLYERKNNLHWPWDFGWSSIEMYSLVSKEVLSTRIAAFFSKHCRPTPP